LILSRTEMSRYLVLRRDCMSIYTVVVRSSENLVGEA